MKILVTGAEGKIGRKFVAQGAVPLDVDVTDLGAVHGAILKNVNYVLKQPFVLLHLAAETDVDYCERNTKVAFNTNVLGTSNVLEATRHAGGRVVLFSTCHVFSGERYFPYSEKHTPSPINQYGLTKFAAEGLCTSYSNSLVFRIGRVYTNEDRDKINNRLWEGEAVPNFIVRSYIHIDELIGKVNRLLEIPVERFPTYRNWYRVLHVGSDKNWSQHRFYNSIRSESGLSELPPRTQEIGGLAPRPRRLALNVGAMNKLLK